MGKHKKHHYGHKSSSSSSSSSSDSSDGEYKHLPKHERKRMKKLRKQMKKGKIPPGSVPGMYPAGAHGVPHGMPHGAPHGGYPGQPGYPPAGGYPTGVAPPPAGYAPPPGQMYPGQAPGYPGQAPGYPHGAPNPAYPAGGAGGQASSGITAGQYDYTKPGAPPVGQPGYPGAQLGYAPAPGGQPGYAPPPGGQPGYAPPPGGQPGYAPQPGGQPGYAPPPGGQPGYAPQPGGQPGYAPPPGGQPGYAPPPGGQPGYAPPPGGQPGYAPPPGGQPGGQTGQPGLSGQFQQLGIHGNMGMPRPVIRPAPNFSAEKDAEIIRKAMKGAGTDEQAIINVISQRSNQQRVNIMNMFKTMYGKDLIKDLESELSGDFRETIMAMFKPTTFYDAWSLHEAIKGLGTKESALIEILCTRTNAEIQEINNCYKQYYHQTLEKDIVNDTSGHFKRLLVSCCQANRTELTPEQWQRVQTQGPESVIDRNLAREDAQKLYQAGEKKLGTDESAFLTVLAVRHYFQLRATFEEYVKIAGRDILSTIDREMSGDLKDGFIAIVMSAKNRPEYFADKLYHAMKGAGTSDSTLIRIVVSRSEVDLQDIKEVYLSKYKKTLATAVSSDTSGDYKRILLAVIGQ
ncbi:annexin A7-like isoform X2 [Ruditapes philippinarum]|uniref:annexin A7-like isoform X2 n=1 Tax=Ruditapes philippinarum TaxID=129788 RepID=UPI00295A6272|nr:annexin A7-like isoform X2 [Ruditapes philippinarum]